MLYTLEALEATLISDDLFPGTSLCLQHVSLCLTQCNDSIVRVDLQIEAASV